MKATPRHALTFALPIALTLLASCSEPGGQPRPTPAPSAIPSPLPPPTPQADWRQTPLTPGDWQWGMVNGQSVARFAGGTLELRCDRRGGTITMLRSGSASGQIPVTIMTSALTRPLNGVARSAPVPAVAVTFPVRDPILDAMAFSRGRFAVEMAGLPTLYVPSWPEVSRVIEDCR